MPKVVYRMCATLRLSTPLTQACLCTLYLVSSPNKNRRLMIWCAHVCVCVCVCVSVCVCEWVCVYVSDVCVSEWVFVWVYVSKCVRVSVCVCESECEWVCVGLCVSTSCTGDEVKLHLFLTSAPDKHQWSATHSSSFTPREEPQTHSIWGWVSPRGGLDIF